MKDSNDSLQTIGSRDEVGEGGRRNSRSIVSRGSSGTAAMDADTLDELLAEDVALSSWMMRSRMNERGTAGSIHSGVPSW